MARQSRGRPAARPAPRPAAPQQTRSASTAAAPPAYAQTQAPPVPAGATQARQPGMMAQMAATAGSVAVGSTIGHGLSSMLFGGGGGHAAAAAPEAAPPAQQTYQQQPGISCDFQAKEFTKCLESADVNACSWYLEQLKACQAAARPY